MICASLRSPRAFPEGGNGFHVDVVVVEIAKKFADHTVTDRVVADSVMHLLVKKRSVRSTRFWTR